MRLIYSTWIIFMNRLVTGKYMYKLYSITYSLGCIQWNLKKLQLMEPDCMPQKDLKASDREGRTSLCITFGQYLSILALFWRKILICTEKTTNTNVYKDHNRLFNLTGGFFLPQEESKAAERPSLLLCNTIDMLHFQNNFKMGRISRNLSLPYVKEHGQKCKWL